MPFENRRISIKYRLMGWFSFFFVLTTVLTAGTVYVLVRDTIKQNVFTELRVSSEAIQSMVRTAAQVSVRNRLRAIAEKNVDILSGLQRRVDAGELTPEQARAEGKRILRSQSIGSSGYVYVIQTTGKIAMHPASSLEGEDISSEWLGQKQAEMKQGYLEYTWANPGELTKREKALYMEYYAPWDWIVSVSSYRSEFNQLIDHEDFRAGVEDFALGDSGYAFLMTKQGNMLIHPWIHGHVTEFLPDEDHTLFTDMVLNRNGRFSYSWKEPSTGTYTEKVMVYREIPELGWIVGSTGYVDEVYAPLYRIQSFLIFSGILTVLIVLPLAYYLGRSFSNPITKLATSMSQADKGDLSVRAEVDGYGEAAELATHFNQYMERLGEYRNELQNEIDERRRAEQQLQLFAMVFENALEGISITDKQGNIVAVNPSFTIITGFEPEDVLGKNPRVLKSDRHEESFYREMWESLYTNGSWHGEIWNRRKNGESYPEILSISAVQDKTGSVSNYVAVFHDISDMKLKDKQIEHQAYHDALTGLPNRSLAHDRLSVAITHAKRDGSSVVVLFMDLDNFKKINDSMGHSFGDLLLKEVAARLRKDFPDADTIARLGGDEFLMIIEGVGEEREVASLAERALAVFETPYVVRGEELHVTPSIGVTMYPDDGSDAETLIKNADMAMYQSKAKGKNAYFLFTQEVNLRISKRLKLENDMRQALKNREFTVYFQPKVNLFNDVVTGMEALVRWHKPDGTVVSPADFIPLAEETGLIVPLGEYVMDASCKAMQLFEGIGCDDISIAVNLSPIQFDQEDLVEMITEKLEMNGVSPSKIELEITESTLMTNVEKSIAKLNMLVDMGMSISIDDFGTGHSSLYYLKNFPIDRLKIDRSFIRDITTDESDAQIVETIILMAGNLGIGVVAEGAETKEQIDMLQSFNCELVQGYYYSPPLPLEDVIVYLRSEGVDCHI